MDLRLRIPEVATHLDASVEVRPVYVEEWVEALPFADPMRVFRGLFDRVRELNHAPMRAGRRAELLELMLPAYLELVERQSRLDARYSNAAFERYRAEADAARQVALQFAMGYKLVLMTSAESRSLLRGQRRARQGLQRAMLMLSYALLHAYHQYLPQLPTLWQELHELYSYARRQQLHRQGGQRVDIRAESGDSAGMIYARIALLSAADPLHMHYGEVWDLMARVSSDPKALRVRTPGSSRALPNDLVLLPERDTPPVRLSHVEGELPTGSWLVETTPVAIALRAHHTTSAAALALAATLEHAPQRSSERVRAQGQLRLTAGLSSVHHFSGGTMSASDFGQDQAAATSDHIEIDDLDPEDTLPSTYAYIADSWQLVNQSHSGVCLTRSRRSQNTPMVGELVGLRAPAEGQQQEAGAAWAVGLVRWLTIDASGTQRLGIQVLSPNARAVMLRRRQDLSGSRHPALILASHDKTRVRVVVPGGTYKPGERISVEFNNREIELTPESMVLSTDSVECLDCTQ